MIGCRRGVEDLPFKLLITGIVLAVVLPLGLGAFTAYDRGSTQSRVEAELIRLARIIDEMGVSHGNRREVTMDLRGGTAASVDHVHIGGPLGSGYDFLLNFSVEGERSRVLVKARITGPGNATLALPQGEHHLTLESHLDSEGRVYILATRAGT